MALREPRTLLAAFAALCGAAGSFVVTTVGMDSMPDTVFIGLSALVAFVIAAAVLGADGIAELRQSDQRTLWLAAAGGALALWAAPLFALAQRATDAPSGADALFFSSSVWGLACVALAYATVSERPLITAPAGAFAAVAGTAGLLASWESPSSFSPFAKFPMREALMIVAAGLFAAGALVVADAARRSSSRIAVTAALGGAAAVGVLTAIPSLPGAVSIGRGVLLPCVYLGVCTAIFALGWTHVSASAGIARASVSLLCVPLAVQALAVVEQLTRVYGPSPTAWAGAVAGSAVLLGGATTVWLSPRQREHAIALADGQAEADARRATRVPLWLSAGSLVCALAALATPALGAFAEGGTSVPFSARWTMVGAESAVGWLAVSAGALAVAAALAARTRALRRTWMAAAAASLVSVVATVPLAATTLHTWNTWVPADVQQTYGTEYSRLVIESRIDPLRVASLVLAVAGTVLLFALVARTARAKEDV